MHGLVVEAALQSYIARMGREEVLPSLPLHKLMIEELDDTMRPEQRSKEFRLRLSGLGKPLCQTIAEKEGWKKTLAEPQRMPMRLASGNLLESYVVMLLRASGLPVDAVQIPTSVEIGDAIVRGTADIIIGGTLFDIKTASDFSFKKFASGFDAILESDPFGYVVQGYCYAEGLDMPFGGWIVVNKNTGDICVCCTPDLDADIKARALATARESVDAVLFDRDFTRSFEAVEETFSRKPTGNKVLDFTCSYCPFKKECWPGLISRPAALSTAMSPRIVDYTELRFHKVKDEDGHWNIEEVELG